LVRAEFEFPTDAKSRLALGIEGGWKTKIYSNFDDKGKAVKGAYHSVSINNGMNGFDYDVSKITDMAFAISPSVRYITAMSNRLTVGLSGTMAFEYGLYKEVRAFYHADDIGEYQSGDEEILRTVTKNVPLNLSINPTLGIGLCYAIVPDQFLINAGAGGRQKLYSLSVGTAKTQAVGKAGIDDPVSDEEWGKPEAQLSLGATFMFKKGFALDALFSANGISLEKANFVVQFSASY
jgi:hypothetical protein